MPKESISVTVSNLRGKQDLKQIKKKLGVLPGVASVSVNQENRRVAIDFDNTGVSHGQIMERLGALGYEIGSAEEG
jgi:copper chaperone CopZ